MAKRRISIISIKVKSCCRCDFVGIGYRLSRQTAAGSNREALTAGAQADLTMPARYAGDARGSQGHPTVRKTAWDETWTELRAYARNNTELTRENPAVQSLTTVS